MQKTVEKGIVLQNKLPGTPLNYLEMHFYGYCRDRITLKTVIL